MVKRRAVSKADKEMQPDRLPMLYKTLVPLTAERQSGYYLSPERDYAYANMVNAIPVTTDEFAQAMRNYPIVLAGSDIPTPVALVGFETGRNDHVTAEGTWKEGAYIPAYLRRYPDFEAKIINSEGPTGSAISLPKDSPLRRDINAALTDIKASGEMNRLITKWFS